MKRNHRIRWQVTALMLIFYILGMIISIFVVYYSARNTYLKAKNDMIERDLVRIHKELTEWSGMQMFFEYSKQHPDEITQEMTAEDYDIVDEATLKLLDKKENEIAALLSESEKLALSKDLYGHVQFTLDNELSSFNYGSLWMIGVGEDDLGFVYHIAQEVDENSAEQSADDFGQQLDMDIDEHPAIEKLRSGSSTAFEIVDSSVGGNNGYDYIAYMPIEFDGKLYAAIGLAYNWDDFHSQLIDQLWVIAGALSAAMAIFTVILLRYLNKIALKPLSDVQHTLRDYIKDKDSSTAAHELNKITVRNEIGILSDDVSELVREIDEYTNSYKTLTTEVMEALAHTIDAKDKYTNGHSFRVAVYSRMLAKELGMSQKDQEDIYYMGLLHDIGKIGIPYVIINKTSKLTDEEYETIKKHPVYGYEILAEIESMPELSIGARYHHERIDGRGYPDGLKGDEIPFMARIIAVADSYDTMTSNRSYRAYLPQDVVREEIEKNIGTQFDEAPARAMLKIIDADKNYMLHE